MDLAEIRKDNKSTEKFALVVSDVFTRKLFVQPLQNKKPITVVEALKRIKAPKPYTVSTDRGGEFLNPVMGKYLDSINVVHRYKEAPNSLAVVDRGMQQLKQKLAHIQGNTGRPWGESLQKAAAALNNTPKDMLHGASPNEVGDDEPVQFMLYQDNAEQMQHNQDLLRKKQAKLGTTFRPPLPTERKFRRSFRPAYGPVQTVDSVEAGVVSSGGQNYNIQTIQPVFPESREVMPARRLRIRFKS